MKITDKPSLLRALAEWLPDDLIEPDLEVHIKPTATYIVGFGAVMDNPNGKQAIVITYYAPPAKFKSAAERAAERLGAMYPTGQPERVIAEIIQEELNKEPK